jgi:hypothetical protein
MQITLSTPDLGQGGFIPYMHFQKTVLKNNLIRKICSGVVVPYYYSEQIVLSKVSLKVQIRNR